MENGLVLVICLFGLGVLFAIAIGIGIIINEIQSRLEKKRRDKLIKEYPELKELLAEYMRIQNNVSYTASKIFQLKEEINKQIEENKYLPKGDRVDAYIETLKEKYKWLDELRENQTTEKELAYKKLILFWETNFPNLKEEKRIMWWYW